MEMFLKAVAAALITAVLCLVMAKQGKDTAVPLTVLACVMILSVALGYLNQLVEFFDKLEDLVGLEGDYFRILLKVVGIGIIGEMSSMICADAGNGALGKAIQILGTVLILCISLPLYEGLLDLIGSILEGL